MFELVFDYAERMPILGALDTATVVTARAQELAQTPWPEVDGGEVVEAAAAVAAAGGLIDAAMVAIAGRLGEADTMRVLDTLGWASVKDFLTHLTGGRRGTGGGLVRAAEQLRDLPEVQTALEDGRITLPQARAIASKTATLPRVPEFRAEVAAKMLALADERGYDATGLETAFADVVREADPTGQIVNTDAERAKAERGAHHARYLSFAEDQYGGVRVKGYGTVENAERIKTVLFPLAAPVTTEPGACGGHHPGPGAPMYDADGVSTSQRCLTPACAHDGRDPREAGVRMWDALVEACDRLTATETLPRDHRAPARVMVTIDHASLRQQVIDAGHAKSGTTVSGGSLSADAVRRLACDAEIIPAVLGTEGQPLDVGRAHRLVTPALWVALIARDRHCAFPGCTRMPLACDAHHITHWADGGPTSLDNLVMLCRHHHTLTHHSPWTVRIDPHTELPTWTRPPRATLQHLHTAGGRYQPARPRAA